MRENIHAQTQRRCITSRDYAGYDEEYVDVSGKIHIAARSDTGKKRAHNEDAVGQRPDYGVVVLADGMGGCRAGEVASGIAVNTLLDALGAISGKADTEEPTQADVDLSLLKAACNDAIIACNKVIYRTAESQPQYKGMGTTLVCALFHDNRIVYSHVGDSRIYRFRDGQLTQLTTDHTLAQEFIERGFASSNVPHPPKNLITRALGVDSEVEPSVAESEVLVGDIYLFCSDGLHDMISDTEIQHVLLENSKGVDHVADKLIDLANDKGGEDNVSVILASIAKPYPHKRIWYQKLANWL